MSLPTGSCRSTLSMYSRRKQHRDSCGGCEEILSWRFACGAHGWTDGYGRGATVPPERGLLRRPGPRKSCGLSYNYHPHLFDVSDTGLEAREREWCVDGCGDGAIRGEGEAHAGRALRGPAGCKRRKLHKLTAFSSSLLLSSTTIQAGCSELP